MASPDEIYTFITQELENIRENKFKLVVCVEKKGNLLSFDDSIICINTIREAIAIAAANYIFISWLAEKRSAEGQRLFYLNDYLDYLSLLPKVTPSNGIFFSRESEDFLAHSRRLLYGLGTYFEHPLKGIDLYISIDQIYHENPNWFKILVAGNALVVVSIATIFAIQTAYQTFGASDCRNAYLQYGQSQADMIFNQARLQGRMTKELQDSYDTAIKSSIAAAESCNSIFNILSIKFGKTTVQVAKNSDR